MKRQRHTDYWNVRTHSDRGFRNGKLRVALGITLFHIGAGLHWVFEPLVRLARPHPRTA